MPAKVRCVCVCVCVCVCENLITAYGLYWVSKGKYSFQGPTAFEYCLHMTLTA